MQFLAEMWPKEQLALLAPRAALLCEGTAFKKIARLSAEKLKANDMSGIKLLVSTLGGAWGKIEVEEKYDTFEKAIFGTIQKNDETNDSYLARHDVHFEELLSKGTTLDEMRAYILLRQSQLSTEDRKRIVVEHGGKLEYGKVCSSIRLLGSRFFGDLQGQKVSQRSKVYDANLVEEPPADDSEKAFTLSMAAGSEETEPELDGEFLDAMVACEDQDALQVQSFEDELELFFQETPELQEALVSYVEARARLLAKRKSRGFWPVSNHKGGKASRSFKGKGKGKQANRDQLLQRIARSTCRACGERAHWKAECPKYGKPGSMSGSSRTTEATTSVAQVDPACADDFAILEKLPEDAVVHVAEAMMCKTGLPRDRVSDGLSRLVTKVQGVKPQPSKTPTLKPPLSLRTPFRMAKTTPQVTESRTPPVCSLLPQELPEVSANHAREQVVEAVLDTGASRCVMGKVLLEGLMNQFDQRSRAEV
jgi:hypothetical protein